MWNTTEGGPCVLRPIKGGSVPYVISNCLSKGAWCDDNNVVHGGKLSSVIHEMKKPWWSAGYNSKMKRLAHYNSWNNAFMFPWEVGMYWNLTVGGVGQRATGCPGLTDFGTVKPMKVNWPYRSRIKPIFASSKMECGRNEYKPSGEEFTMAEVIDKLAADNVYFAEKFLEGW